VSSPAYEESTIHARTRRTQAAGQAELGRASRPFGHPLLDLQRSAGNRGVSALVQRVNGADEIEMEEISLRKRLEGRRYVLQNSPYPGMIQLAGTRVHILATSLAPNYTYRTEFGNLVTGFLDHGLVLFRGIPKWHEYWFDAVAQGVARPFGAGPPDFDTQRSRFLPFSESEDIATYAAQAERGAAHANRPAAELAKVSGHRHHNPEEVVGVVLRVEVDRSSAIDVAFLKPGEVQLGGPVQAHVHRVLRAAANPSWRRRERLAAEV
jgi:hypothetical protein